MDANQMGGFIAQQRKSLGLTQVQLAERGTRFREDGLKMGERLWSAGYRQSGTISGSS